MLGPNQVDGIVTKDLIQGDAIMAAALEGMSVGVASTIVCVRILALFHTIHQGRPRARNLDHVT